MEDPASVAKLFADHLTDHGDQLRLMARENDKLRASLRRVADSLATFIRETEDPGNEEALDALYESQQLLSRV